MKTIMILVVVASASFAVWQRIQIGDLREMEQRLVREKPGSAPYEKAQKPETPPIVFPMATGLAEEELKHFTAEILARRTDFEPNRFNKMANLSAGNWIAYPELCEPLSRLTSRQLLSVLEAWSGGAPIVRNSSSGIGNFLMMTERVNPAALTQLYYERKAEKKEPPAGFDPNYAFDNWFGQDPHGLANWARSSGYYGAGDKKCDLWVDAAEVLRAPSVENVARLIAHKSFESENAASQVATKLPSDEARLQFFQSLHAASGGKVEGVGQYVSRLVENTTFAKLSHLADSVPSFSAPPERKYQGIMHGEPRGSLRYEVAVQSRDSTAEARWRWLIQRPEDRPSGNFLKRLVNDWCDRDYPDTANWVRTLPPGPERDKARKTVVEFLEWNREYELAKEWKEP